MAIPKKERFNSPKIKMRISNNTVPFPPENITYQGNKLVLLGKSNKDDLFPTSIEEPGLVKASMNMEIGQFVYSNEKGDLFECLLYIDEVMDVVLYSIRTRLLP